MRQDEISQDPIQGCSRSSACFRLVLLLHSSPAVCVCFVMGCDCTTARVRVHGAKVSPGRRRLHWADFPPMLTASQQPPPLVFPTMAIPAVRGSIDSCWWSMPATNSSLSTSCRDPSRIPRFLASAYPQEQSSSRRVLAERCLACVEGGVAFSHYSTRKVVDLSDAFLCKAGTEFVTIIL